MTKKLQWHKRSIASYFSLLTVILILVQITVLTSLLIFGGVFKQTKMSSYQAFNDTVNNRRDYLQQEVRNRWTNLTPYLPELSVAVSDPASSTEEVFDQASDTLIRILRLTGTTGAYLILDDPNLPDNQQPALYFRDYDPLTDVKNNRDIHVVYGPANIASKYQLPLDAIWQYHLTLTDDNEKFFKMPFDYSKEDIGAKYLGYWHKPFQLTKEDTPIITYSIPLKDINNRVVGVVGIELAVNYLTKFLPMTELQTKDSLGYIIANKNDEDEVYQTLFTTNNIQKRFLNPTNLLSFENVDEDFQIFSLSNHQTQDTIYATMAKFNLYEYNSPFQDEEWYIIGFMKSEHLLNYVFQIRNILLLIIVTLLVSGVASAVFISRKMSKPVVSLAHQVVNNNRMESLCLKKTGLQELDDLSKAIIQTNQFMLDSASRLSKIIDLVDLPIAAFEIDRQTNQVFVTGKFYKILGIEDNDTQNFETTEQLDALLKKTLALPEPDSNDIYKLTGKNDQWVRLKFSKSESHIYGIVEDVTGEVLKLRKIKHDRDYDPLTKLFNRRSFQNHFEEWLDEKTHGVAALIMFDLDFLKPINDTYGHKWGDYYIIEAVNRLRNIADEHQALLSRRSGDEFILLLHNFEHRDAILHKIRTFYEQLDRELLEFPSGEQRPIRISAGLTWIDETLSSKNYEQLLHHADEALYYSKQYNKGSFTEYTDQLNLFDD